MFNFPTKERAVEYMLERARAKAVVRELIDIIDELEVAIDCGVPGTGEFEAMHSLEGMVYTYQERRRQEREERRLKNRAASAVAPSGKPQRGRPRKAKS